MKANIKSTSRRTTITFKAGKGEDLRGIVEAITGISIAPKAGEPVAPADALIAALNEEPKG